MWRIVFERYFNASAVFDWSPGAISCTLAVTSGGVFNPTSCSNALFLMNDLASVGVIKFNMFSGWLMLVATCLLRRILDPLYTIIASKRIFLGLLFYRREASCSCFVNNGFQGSYGYVLLKSRALPGSVLRVVSGRTGPRVPYTHPSVLHDDGYRCYTNGGQIRDAVRGLDDIQNHVWR